MTNAGPASLHKIKPVVSYTRLAKLEMDPALVITASQYMGIHKLLAHKYVGYGALIFLGTCMSSALEQPVMWHTPFTATYCVSKELFF